MRRRTPSQRADRRAALNRNAEILVEVARLSDDFDGDFVRLAENLGWTSGTFWRQNPAISIAAKRWRAALGGTP